MKKILVISMIIVISMITGCGKKKEGQIKQEQEQGNVNVNTKEEVIGDKQVEVFKFEKTSLTYDNKVTRLQTRVTNTSEEEQTLIQFRVHFIKDEKEIINLPGYVGKTLKPKETKILTTTYGGDITDITRIEYEIIK